MEEAKPDSDRIEQRARAIGRGLLQRSAAAAPGVLQSGWWEEQMLQWAMRDDRLRTQLFRFVDVLPSLQTGREVAAHLLEYLRVPGVDLPSPLAQALRFSTPGSLGGRLAALAARQNVRRLGRRFIAGETPDEAIACVTDLRKRKMAFTLDALGEAVTSDAQADAYAEGYLELIESLCRAALDWQPVSPIDDADSPRVNVSLKLTALDPHFDPIAPTKSKEVVLRRLRPILRLARERSAFVNVDMEEFRYKDLTLEIFKSVFMDRELRDFAHVGIVVQAYLRDSERDLSALIEWAQARGCPVTVRLVKGAYWEHEMTYASQRGWPIPVFTEKWETDLAFERLAERLMHNAGVLRPAIASHNIRSLAKALALAEAHRLSPKDFEIQMLYGMGDPLKQAIVDRGLFLRVYAPFGPLIPGMGYLIRRLLENTSNDSFLRQSFHEDVPVETLIADPMPASAPQPAQSSTGERAS